MDLYKETEKPLQWKPSVQVRAKELATLDDIKAALAEHGLVAVPLEPTDEMIERGCLAFWNNDRDTAASYKAMIKAAEEK